MAGRNINFRITERSVFMKIIVTKSFFFFSFVYLKQLEFSGFFLSFFFLASGIIILKLIFHYENQSHLKGFIRISLKWL